MKEQFTQINGLKVRYKTQGSGEVVLFLHGWGGSADSGDEIAKYIGDNYQFVSVDFPGFGQSDEPKTPWTVSDYVSFVMNFLDAIDVKSVFLITHSFGGRVAIKVATSENAQRIKAQALCASAGIQPKRGLKYHVFYIAAKCGKFVFSLPILRQCAGFMKKLLYRGAGAGDYNKVSGVMRETFLKVTQEDLKPLLSKIATPTLLFWGKNDSQTPISDGKIMEREINGAKLYTFDGVRHAVHKKRAKEICEVVKSFF